jgi:hypothetical protein
MFLETREVVQVAVLPEDVHRVALMQNVDRYISVSSLTRPQTSEPNLLSLTMDRSLYEIVRIVIRETSMPHLLAHTLLL